MSIRNLACLLQPASVTLIGASQKPGSPGNLVAQNLRSGGFDGEITAVNPKYTEVDGLPCFATVAELPQPPQLAVIVTPARTVAELIGQLAERGTRAAVVISAGVTGKLQQAMLDAAQVCNFRILGPDSLGIINPLLGLNASFAHLHAPAGHIALLAQSGAVLTAMIDWAVDRDIGFSHLLSLGAMADIDFGDLLNYLAEDNDTRAILLYVEAITHSRKFMSAARAAARLKPVIVLKSGRFSSNDRIYDAAFARAGLLRVYSIAELFDMAATLAHTPRVGGDRLVIISNDAGMAMMAADVLTAEHGRLAELAPEMLKQLDKVLPGNWSRANPIDIPGDAPAQCYADTLALLQQTADIDAVLVLHCPVAMASNLEIAQAVVDSALQSQRPLLTSWIGSHTVSQGRRLFIRHHIPSYDSPAEAVHAFMQLVSYRRNQELLMETPASLQFDSDQAAAASIIARALSENRAQLNEQEIMALLDTCAIPAVTTYHAADADEAAQLAAGFQQPVLLTLSSPDLTSVAGAGNAVAGLKGREQVRLAALGLQTDLARRFPKARLQGFSLQPAVHWPQAYELMLGMFSDPLFGPVLWFGHGGTAGELTDDKTLALPPLNSRLAREMIAATRIGRLLRGYRDQPLADNDAVVLTLIKLSQLIADQPHIVELQINPLLAAEQGVLALNVRVRISNDITAGAGRLAIKPYPAELEQDIRAPDNGEIFLLRPIRAEDEPALIRAFQKLNPQEIRLRFHHPLKMEHRLAARLTQIDYDREMALIMTDVSGQNDIHGVVRLNADPDHRRAEFAIIVAHSHTRRGLGELLLRRMIDYAREQGITELYGSVLKENDAMLGLCRKLGFTIEPDPDGFDTLIVNLKIS